MTTNTWTIILFLGGLAVILLGGAGLAIWTFNENRRINRVMRDGLADIDHDSWSREYWWR